MAEDFAKTMGLPDGADTAALERIVKEFGQKYIDGELTEELADRMFAEMCRAAIHEAPHAYAEEARRSNRKTQSDAAETLRALKGEIQKTPLFVSEQTRGNITDYNDFRKANFNRLKLTHDKSGQYEYIDSFYERLRGQYGDMRRARGTL